MQSGFVLFLSRVKLLHLLKKSLYGALSILSLIAFSFAEASWIVRTLSEGGQNEKILSIKKTHLSFAEDSKVLSENQAWIQEGLNSPSEIYKEIYFSENKLPVKYLKFYKQMSEFKIQNLGFETELRTFINRGSPENRIDLVILGDGYTIEQKELFFEDAKRITDDLFSQDTFSTYLPLFNVYAIFAASKESGLTDLTKKETVFGLYRDPKGSKRAIMPRLRNNIESVLRLAPDVDYPIIIANDDYYGGLGGAYAITTRSLTSGAMVLRHELGHNFGNVGEEYDGGSVYRGANFSSSSNVAWKHWIDGEIKDSEIYYLAGNYDWWPLKNNPYKLTFDFPNSNSPSSFKFFLDISAVGWSRAQEVTFRLDTEPLELEGDFTADRSFFKLKNNIPLKSGNHAVQIIDETQDGDNVVAFVRAYAMSSDFDEAPFKISAFKTFNDEGTMVGYRPTHQYCLMRNMKATYFCAVDLENMWIKFLNRVSLIDQLEIKKDKTVVLLQTPQLQPLEIRWYQVTGKNEVELTDFRNLKQMPFKLGNKGSFMVRVYFKTNQVRINDGIFMSEKPFSL